MVKILARVTSCRTCPNRQYYSGGVYECVLVKAHLVDSGGIPAWCPLPDDPAHVAAKAESDLHSARAYLNVAVEAAFQEGVPLSRVQDLLREAQARLAR